MRRLALGGILLAALGCTSEENLSPQAALAGPTSTRVGREVVFDGAGSRDPDGRIASWAFDFGDGKSAPAGPSSAVSHTYAEAKTFAVVLTVTDDAGAEAKASYEIAVTANEPPVASFTAPPSAAVGEPVAFDGSASTDADGTIAKYEWDLDGDGKQDATGQAVAFVFQNPGQFPAKLTVTDNDGAPAESSHLIEIASNLAPQAHVAGPASVRIDELASFDGGGSTDADGTIATYEWDFDYDGQAFEVQAQGPAVNTSFAKAGAYTVALRVTDDDKEWAVATHALEVTANVAPLAKLVGPSKVRIDETASFDGSLSTDADGLIAKYEWDLDYDGKLFATSLVGPAINASYQQAGAHVVALRVTDNDGGEDVTTLALLVTPNQAPVAALQGPAKVRIDETASFDGSLSTDADGTIVKFEWDLDYDGKLFGSDASGPTINASYPKAGSYVVALRVTDNDGGEDLTTQVLVVTPNQAPVAKLAGPAKVRIDETASFDAGQSSDPDGKLVKFEWDFDYDGKLFAAQALGPAVGHGYAQAGSYLVALRVTDNDGGEDVTTAALEVTPNEKPVAKLGGPAKVRVNELAGFDGSGSSDPDGKVVKYEWDFDYDGKLFDVQASGPAVGTTFPKAGAPLVALRVTDNDGGEDIATAALEVTPNQAPAAAIQGPAKVRVGEPASLGGGQSSDPDGKVVKYEWDFDYDGQNFAADAAGPAVNWSYAKAGSYLVALRVTDNDGGEGTTTHALVVTPNQAPVAAILGPTQVRVQEPASFDGTASSDPDGVIAKHEWDFDYDGQNFGADATGPKVAKSYAKAGPYLVALRVTDNDGGQNLTTQALVVTPNQAPAAAISGPAKVRVDAVASFDAGLSSDADGVVVKYEWDFGYDGQNFAADVSGPKVNQFYAQAGSYLVALRVTDNDGAQGLTTHAIEVTPNQAPAAAITGPAKVRVNEIASFDASLSSDADGVVVLQEWDFDYDGNNFDVQATGPKTNGSYPQAGSYLVALRVTDNDGAQDVTTHALAVTPNQPPQAAISGPSQADVGALLSLSGAGSTDADGTIADYEWDFDYDGQSFDVEATGAQVNTSFPQAGSYLVALRVTDNDGAQGLTTQALTIEPLSELAVLDVTPGSGPRRGGEQVTITGTGFTSVPDTVVTFDGVPAVVLSVPSYDTMTARTPAGIPGPADVAVTNSNGAAELPDGYVYEGESNRAGTAFCWIDATAGTNLGFPVNADDLTRPTTVGFDFGFFGELFPAGADLYVTSNGWASFSESQAMFQHFAIPSPSNPSHLVAPLFFDQRIGPTGAVYARTTGVQPNRRLAVEWKDVTDAGGAARFRYQAVLFEGSDDVALQYRNSAQFDYNPLNDAAAGASALIGIQNADGSAGAQYARNAFLTGLAPGGRTVVFRPQPDGSYDIDSGTTLSVAGTDLPPGARLGNGGTVKLWLSKPIDATTAVANSSVRVNNLTDGGTVPVVLSLAPSKDVLYVTVPAGLVTGKNYELRLTTAVKDLAGKPLSQDPMGLSCGSNSPTDYASAFTYFPRSCLDIKLGSPAAPSGLYSIDPDGGVGQAPFTVYCEMTANGGGWTLLMKIDGNQATFDYDAALWTNTNTLNPGSPNLDMTQAKLLGFGTMPFTALRLGMLVGGVTRWIVVPHTASSLLSRFVGGAVVTSAGRNAWKSLFPAPSLQPFCDWEGFNVGVAGAARARIGIVSNENGVGDCSSPDSRIGFGTDGNFCGQDDANTCGNEARCGGDGGDVSTRAFGYVMIR